MRRFLAMLLLLAFIVGCSSKETAVKKGYFYFSGDTKGVEISIDKGQRFGIVAGQNNLYTIAFGSHTIEIYRGDLKLVSYTFVVHEDIVKEIVIQ